MNMKKIIALFISFFILSFIAGDVFAENTNALVFGDFEYIVLSDGAAEITKYTGKEKLLKIPSSLDGHDVKSIGDSSFKYKIDLQVVIIEYGIEKIGNNAFERCMGLSRIAVPQSVKSIGDYAFADCRNLNGETAVSDEVYNSAKIVEESYAADIQKQQDKIESAQIQLDRWIAGGKKTKEEIEKQRKKIEKEKDKLAALQSQSSIEIQGEDFVIPAGAGLLADGLEYIGNYAFQGCYNLGHIILPETILSIGKNPFYLYFDENIQIIVSPKHPTLAINKDILYSKPDKRLVRISTATTATEIVIPDGIMIVDDFAFYSVSRIKKITLPESLIAIGDYAFTGLSITELKIPNSVTTIGSYAFEGCFGLTSLEFGNSITTIGSGCFSGCKMLKELTVPESVTSIGDNAFPNDIVLTIIPGTVAETYCKENNLKYQYQESDMDWL